MYGIIDCDNCYVSCERVFRPDLNGVPVVVLSNNDGCVVARSNEAKKMGIKAGTPYFQLAFVLNFGDDGTTDSLTPNPSPVREGRKLPRGIYIHNGKKVVIK